MPANLASALITKLTVSNRLDSDDIRALQNLRIQERRLGPRQAVVRDGDRPTECCLLAEGFAFRSKATVDGERQVMSVHIAGEIPDLQSLHLKVMDHDLVTITPCTLGFIAHDEIKRLNHERPNIADAMWRETLIDAAIFREWIVNLGKREALPRTAHLLVELHKRLMSIGYTRDGLFALPVTQADLGDCLGLSTVHVNRVLQFLRKDELITASRSEFNILDHERLEQLAGFDASYLHLNPSA